MLPNGEPDMREDFDKLKTDCEAGSVTKNAAHSRIYGRVGRLTTNLGWSSAKVLKFRNKMTTKATKIYDDFAPDP